VLYIKLWHVSVLVHHPQGAHAALYKTNRHWRATVCTIPQSVVGYVVNISVVLIVTLISVFRRYVDEICAFLQYYAASSCNCLPTFRDNVSVPSSRVKSPRRKERKPANCNVDSGKCDGVAISRRDDVIGCLLSFFPTTREDGTDTLSRNVGKQLPLDAA
jgi:hypothetical protein